jgi:hypothetical protein
MTQGGVLRLSWDPQSCRDLIQALDARVGLTRGGYVERARPRKGSSGCRPEIGG